MAKQHKEDPSKPTDTLHMLTGSQDLPLRDEIGFTSNDTTIRAGTHRPTKDD